MSVETAQKARIEAVARVFRKFDGEYAVDLKEYFRDAEEALSRADEADSNAGITRIRAKSGPAAWFKRHKP